MLENIEKKHVGDKTGIERVEKCKNKIVFKYTHDDLTDLYTKTSVSELKMSAIQEAFERNEFEESSASFFESHEDEAYIPKFIKGDDKVKGTTRGTAYHRIMELFFKDNNADIGSLYSEEQKNNAIEVIERVVKQGKIDEEDAKLVDVNKVVTFLQSDLARKMYEAQKRGDLHLEEPFVLGINADRLKENFPKEEMVLIQGIIDAFYIENDKIVLMDYKTDNVSHEDELVKKYKVQLDYYKEALERITGLEVVSQVIYSFAFGKCIELN